MESIGQIEIKRRIDDALGGAYRPPRSAAVGVKNGVKPDEVLPVDGGDLQMSWDNVVSLTFASWNQMASLLRPN
jgi:hypothetical protein